MTLIILNRIYTAFEQTPLCSLESFLFQFGEQETLLTPLLLPVFYQCYKKTDWERDENSLFPNLVITP